MSSRHHGAGTQPAKEHTHGVHELETMITESPSIELVCVKLARILRVQRNEVALLRVEKGSLRFIFPVELRGAGVIPMTGSAVAARTAASRTSLLSNSFARVKHVSLFESVKLGVPGEGVAEQPPIQKIMSVPVTQADGKVVGVVQVSRKGPDSSLAGTDFTGDDLKLLEQASSILARMSFMEDGAPLGEPSS
jgi:GAF domain-containing protein